MKILLLTDIPPCTNHTSGLVINSWCDFLLEEGHEIYCALVQNICLGPDIPKDKLKRIKFLEIQKPLECYALPKGVKFSKVRSDFRSLYFNNSIRMFKIPQIAREISQFANKHECDVLLASIQGQTITQLVRRVSAETGLDYVAQTWDPLEWWMRAHCFDPLSKALNMGEFKRVIKNSKTFMAMSWAMSVDFEREYKAKCVTNIPGLDSGIYKKPRKNKNGKFVISFAGQLYAKEEFDVLVRALEEMKWNYKGKDIILDLYGNNFDTKYLDIKSIRAHGYLKQSKLINTLGNSDLHYCPYWFSKEYIRASKVSFPAKLTTFLKTGRPILMHAPSYASPRIFLEAHKASYICDSLDIQEVVSTLKEIMDDKKRDEIGYRGYKLFKKYFTYDSMKKSLFASLGLIKREEVKEFESIRALYV